MCKEQHAGVFFAAVFLREVWLTPVCKKSILQPLLCQSEFSNLISGDLTPCINLLHQHQRLRNVELNSASSYEFLIPLVLPDWKRPSCQPVFLYKELETTDDVAKLFYLKPAQPWPITTAPYESLQTVFAVLRWFKKKHKLTRSSEDDVKIGSARLKARHPLFLFLFINLQPALTLCQGWLCSLFFALGAPWAAITETSGYI